MLILPLVVAALSRGPGDCNAVSKEAIVTVDAPGTPFQALPSADGCWVFASVPGGQSGNPSVIALYQRSKGGLSLVRTLQVEGGPTGMALTHDGKTLVVADGDRVAFVDANRLIKGDEGAVLGYLVDSTAKGRVYANVTADDKVVFIADENSKTVSVIDMARARATHYDVSATIGKIPTGTLPIALTFSRDQKLIYITSQWAPESYGWPIECKRETNNPNGDTTSVNPQGAIHVVDVARAIEDPAHSIVNNVRAGCSAVRLVLSPTRNRAYVTARNSNMLLAFDAAKLRSDSAHSLVGRVPVGPAPVGVAVVNGERQIVVTNSNRFAGDRSDQQTLTVIDANKMASGDKAIVGSIPAGAFPREMRVTADGRTLILTNFGSRSIEMIDLARIVGGRR
jgi:DNA-binding beta-propeller fold protein YncE